MNKKDATKLTKKQLEAKIAKLSKEITEHIKKYPVKLVRDTPTKIIQPYKYHLYNNKSKAHTHIYLGNYDQMLTDGNIPVLSYEPTYLLITNLEDLTEYLTKYGVPEFISLQNIDILKAVDLILETKVSKLKEYRIITKLMTTKTTAQHKLLTYKMKQHEN